VEFAEQQFARALASGGGLGLAGIIAKGLERQEAPTAPGSSDPPPSAKHTPRGSGG
jgi:Rod binding domain-containing protein